MVWPMTESIRAVARTAADQHGVFTAAQAEALGVASRSLRNQVDNGLYEVRDGALIVAGSADTWERSVVTAVLSEGDIAAASHQTAAHLLGLVDRRGTEIHVVTRRWLRRPRPGIRLHESNDLIPSDIHVVDGIPTTSPTRTIVDLGATSKWLVRGALGAALRAEMTSLDKIERFVARVARKGRRGVGVIRPMIKERRAWQNATESDLEDEFTTIVRDFSLPHPVAQFILIDDTGAFVSRADFAYPARKVLIELDGFASHSDADTFQRDRTKQNRATLLGWTVLRYTWNDLTARPGAVAAEIGALLA